MNDKSATFESVIDLCGMETQCTHVSSGKNTRTIDLNAKGMRCIVDDLKAILIGNILNRIHLNRLTIAMYRHNGSGLGGDSSLDLVGIDATGFLLDVDKHRFAAIPPNAMGGGHETIGCSNHLTRDAKGLERSQQWKCSIGEEADIRHFQILSQSSLQLLVKLAIVGYPFTCPDFLEHLVELIKIRQQRRDYGYLIIHLNKLLYYFVVYRQ